MQELADAIDFPIPPFQIEEDKSKSTKMVLSKKAKEDHSNKNISDEN